MAISRYDQPAQSNALDTFVNTYVPIPFEEMMKVGMMKKQQEDQGFENLAKTYEDTHNLKYISGSEDEKYIKQHVLPTSEDIFNRYANQDLSDPVVQRKMRMEFNSKIDRNRIRDIQSSYEGWQNYLKDNAKLKMEGKASPFEEDPSRGWDSSKHGVFTKSPEAYNDPIKEIRENLFAPVHDSTLKSINLGEGNIEVMSGVNQKMIDDITVKNLPNYLRNNTGRNAIKEFRASTGLTEDQASDAKILAMAFRAAGEPYLRQNQKIEHMQRPRPDKNKGTKPMFSNASNTQSLKNTDRVTIGKEYIGVNLNEADDPVKMMKSGHYNEKGNLKINVPSTTGESIKDIWEDIKKSISTGKMDTGTEQVGYADISKLAQNYNNQRTIINSIKESNPELANSSDIEVMGAYAKAYKNAENVDYNVYLYPNDSKNNVAKDMTDLITKDLGGRLLYSAQTGKHAGEPINTIDDIFKKLNVPKADRKRSNISVSGAVPAKNAYKASIAASDGPHDFLVSTNQREQHAFKLVEDANRLANNGILGDKPLVYKDENGNITDKYTIRTHIDMNGPRGPEFVSDIVMGNKAMSLNELEYRSAHSLEVPDNSPDNTQPENITYSDAE